MNCAILRGSGSSVPFVHSSDQSITLETIPASSGTTASDDALDESDTFEDALPNAFLQYLQYKDSSIPHGHSNIYKN